MKSLIRIYLRALLIIAINFACCGQWLISQNLISFGQGTANVTPQAPEEKVGTLGEANVNLFNGTSSYGVQIGTVNHTNGLSFSLSLSYNSTVNGSTSTGLTCGLQYGEGWNLNVPSISVETKSYSKYTNANRSNLLGNPNATLNYYNPNAAPNLRCEDVINEGKLYFSGVNLNLPGVYSGRLVFKEKLFSTSGFNHYLFVPDGFEQYFEVILSSSINEGYAPPYNDHYWTVNLNDGSYYEFRTAEVSHVSASAQRVQHQCGFEEEITQPISKIQYNRWWCNKIGSYNSNGDIKFEYDQRIAQDGDGTFGKHVAVSEFIGYEYFLTAIKSNIEALTLLYKNVFDFDNGQSLYKLNPSNAIDYTPSTNYMKFKEFTLSDFDWRLFLHGKSSHITSCGNAAVINPLNPYLALKIPNDPNFNPLYNEWGYVSYKNPEEAGKVRFGFEEGNIEKSYSHGFLEASSIEDGIASLVPGEFYTMDFKIANAPACLFDVNMASGYFDPLFPDLGYPLMSHSSSINGTDLNFHRIDRYRNARSISIFNTFNTPKKVTSDLNEHVVLGEVYFRPLNIGPAKKKIKIQIGPANSDQRFSHVVPNTNIEDPEPQQEASYYQYPTNVNLPSVEFPLAEGDPVPQNFGVGHPWHMMRADYSAVNELINNGPYEWQWWNADFFDPIETTNGCTDQFINYYQNLPTQLNKDLTTLNSLNIYRLSRSPKVLTQVSKHTTGFDGTLNGKSTDIPDLLEEIARYELTYNNYQVDNFAIYTEYDYDNEGFPVNKTVKTAFDGKRNIIALSSISKVCPGEPSGNTLSGLTTTFDYEVENLTTESYDIRNFDEDVDASLSLGNVFSFIRLKTIDEPNGKQVEFSYHPLYNCSQSENCANASTVMKRTFSNLMWFQFSSNPFTPYDAEGLRKHWPTPGQHSFSIFNAVSRKITSDAFNTTFGHYEYDDWSQSALSLAFQVQSFNPVTYFRTIPGFKECIQTGPFETTDEGRKTVYLHNTSGNRHLHGKLLEITTSDIATGNLVSKSIYDYDTDTELFSGYSGETEYPTITFSTYALATSEAGQHVDYKNSKFIRLNSILNTDYLPNGDALNTSTLFDYYVNGSGGQTDLQAGKFLLKSRSNTNYNGAADNTVEYKYAPQLGYALLQDRNMSGIPVEIQATKNGQFAGGKRSTYLNTGQEIKEVALHQSYEMMDAPTSLVLRNTFDDYDEHGFPKAMTVDNIDYTLEWNPAGLLKTKKWGERQETYGHYINSRLLQSVVDAYGHETNYEYDCFLRTHKVLRRDKSPNSQDFQLKETYVYNAAQHNGGKNEIVQINESADAFIPNISKIYDCRGRMRSEKIISGTPSGGDLFHSWNYNDYGNLIAESIPENGAPYFHEYYESWGLVNKTYREPIKDNPVTYEYSISTSNSNASNSLKVYNGPLKTIHTFDPHGIENIARYDAFEALLYTEADAGTIKAITEFVYDGRDRTIEVVNPENNFYINTWTWNNGWKLDRTIPSKTQVVQEEYDQFGKLIQHTNANGDITSTAYNQYNEIDNIKINGIQAIKYTYYPGSEARGTKFMLKKMIAHELGEDGVTPTTFSVQYDYDTHGREQKQSWFTPYGNYDLESKGYDMRDLVHETAEIHYRSEKTLRLDKTNTFNEFCGLHESQALSFQGMELPEGLHAFTNIEKKYFPTKWLKNRMVRKSPGSGTNNGFFQDNVYGYNDLSWITSINKAPFICGPRPFPPHLRSAFFIGMDDSDFGIESNGTVHVHFDADNLEENNASAIKIKIDQELNNNIDTVLHNTFEKAFFYGTTVYPDTIRPDSFSFTYVGLLTFDDIVPQITSMIESIIGTPSIFNPDEFTSSLITTLSIFEEAAQSQSSACIHNKVFRQMIYYFEEAADLPGFQRVNQFNGNISATSWQYGGQSEIAGYEFKYDGLNRLKDAYFSNQYASGGELLFRLDDYNAFVHDYDKEGNIQGLTRLAPEDITVDQLSYSYDLNSQLQTISDQGSDRLGFIFESASFGYDDEGNVTAQGEYELKYNAQNQIVKILGNTLPSFLVQHTYDATGRKWRLLSEGAEAPLTDRTYLGSFIFNEGPRGAGDQDPEYVNFENGRLTWVPGKEEYRFDFYTRDHLGNIRGVYSDLDDDKEIQLGYFSVNAENEIVEFTDYYPFGMEGLHYTKDASQPDFLMRYNSKEEEIFTSFLDYGARFYDPSMARWLQVDPLADAMPSWSSYSYSFNNPILFVDPVGMSPETIYENAKTGETVEVDDGIDRTIRVNDSDFQEAKFFANEVSLFGTDSDIAEAYRNFYFDNVSYNGFIDGAQEYFLGGGPDVELLTGRMQIGLQNNPMSHVMGGTSTSAVKPIARQLPRFLVRIQKHHIIPKAVYKRYAKELAPFMKLNGGFNLKKLPTPFHGNHPQYNTYVGNRISQLGAKGKISEGSLRALQKELNSMINQAYDSGMKLNDYFRKFN